MQNVLDDVAYRFAERVFESQLLYARQGVRIKANREAYRARLAARAAARADGHARAQLLKVPVCQDQSATDLLVELPSYNIVSHCGRLAHIRCTAPWRKR